MKLKEKNDVLEEIVKQSLSELSKNYSKTAGENFIFEFWYNVRHLDLDKNQCFTAVLDVRRTNAEGKVTSFKRLYDRMVVQRPNIAKNSDGTINTTRPSYGKQSNMEESRNTVLREILAKSLAAFSLALAVRTKDQIEQFNDLSALPQTEEESLEMGYENSFVIPEKFKNPDGTYSVPDDPSIPEKFWGQVVTSKEILWN